MHFAAVAIVALASVSVAYGVKCGDAQKGQVLLENRWQDMPNTNATCISDKWCVYVSGQGNMTISEEATMEFSGVLYKCAVGEEAMGLCDESGEGCKSVPQFGQLTGSLQVCCCDSDMCNGGDPNAPLLMDPLHSAVDGPAGTEEPAVPDDTEVEAVPELIAEGEEDNAELPELPAQPEPTVAETPEAAAEPTAEAAPELTAESAPEPTAEIAPEPAAESAPEPTAEVAPEPAAESAPEPTAEIAPEPTAELSPEPTAEAVPEPAAELSPEPTAEVAAEPEAEPKAEAEPTAEAEPAAESEPKAEAEPSNTVVASAQPEPTSSIGAPEPSDDDLQSLQEHPKSQANKRTIKKNGAERSSVSAALVAVAVALMVRW